MKVWTLSLPVVVIVHGNQEPHAWATVSWDNAFAESPRQCFQVAERVPWPQVADLLNTKFQSACGRSLTEDNIKFLAGKAFRNHNMTDYTQAMLNWNLFAKEPLPDRNFTFWEWFYGILKLTREHLKNLWNDG
jgi:signal transducer and activator of transcription 5B